MRLTVELRGRPTEVEVAADLSSVTVGGRSYPVRVVSPGPLRAELEIGGETVVIDGWPQGIATPPGPVDVNGERSSVRVEAVAGVSGPAAPPPSVVAPAPGAVAPSAVAPGTTAVVPPMPGRVVELRVRVGATVAKGDVLLVLEAMKMRNEVTAPVGGKVLEVRVPEGANVRARETMVVLGPA